MEKLLLNSVKLDFKNELISNNFPKVLFTDLESKISKLAVELIREYYSALIGSNLLRDIENTRFECFPRLLQIRSLRELNIHLGMGYPNEATYKCIESIKSRQYRIPADLSIDLKIGGGLLLPDSSVIEKIYCKIKSIELKDIKGNILHDLKNKVDKFRWLEFMGLIIDYLELLSLKANHLNKYEIYGTFLDIKTEKEFEKIYPELYKQYLDYIQNTDIYDKNIISPGRTIEEILLEYRSLLTITEEEKEEEGN